MIDQTVLNWLFCIVSACGGWILKVVWDAIQELKRDLRQFEREIPLNYTRREDFREEVKELKEDMKAGFARMELTLHVLIKKLDNHP